MFGKTNTGGAPSGALMMLKTLGLDPTEIMANIESAKTTAVQVMQNFDARLKALEDRQNSLEKCLSENYVVLCRVELLLKEITQHKTT